MKNEILSIAYKTFSNFSELSIEDRKLIEEATQAMNNAFAPFSDFFVGAALLLSNGQIISGSNQENEAYPSGLCAERVALFYAKHAFPDEEVVALAIIAKSDKITLPKAVTPCGACRQVMHQTQLRQKTDYRIILAHENGSGLIFNNISALLPFSFQLNP